MVLNIRHNFSIPIYPDNENNCGAAICLTAYNPDGTEPQGTIYCNQRFQDQFWTANEMMEACLRDRVLRWFFFVRYGDLLFAIEDEALSPFKREIDEMKHMPMKALSFFARFSRLICPEDRQAFIEAYCSLLFTQESQLPAKTLIVKVISFVACHTQLRVTLILLFFSCFFFLLFFF